MAESRDHVEEPKNFEPKKPVSLDPPKDDPISSEELAKCDGNDARCDKTAFMGTLINIFSPVRFCRLGLL